jgi:adenosylcobinamide kinase / adenosylcobinamide-phosphate guanylyltransferase
MELLLLGTGSADGWPNPFCGCASCAAARSAGEVRGQTAVLVDDTLLLDCGPEAPRAAERWGRSLRGVQAILLTHDHPDHTGPAALLWRSWAAASERLELIGPPSALAACADWIGPDDPVTLRPARTGDRLDVASYDVRVLPAAHERDAVLYDVTAEDGARLLYATDTGPVAADALDAMRQAAYDIVLLEETFGDWTAHGAQHLDLATFPSTLAQLRRCGAVTTSTDVVAIHLGHRNPPAPELSRRLSSWDARVVPDGTVLHTRDAKSQQLGSSTRRVLILGGARSGKSVEAERRFAAEPHVTYVATSIVDSSDEEWTARVDAHRARRPPGWTTIETIELAPVLRESTGPVLIDCLTLWLGALLDASDLHDRVDELVDAWRTTSASVIAVSNEVGAGVVPATPSGRHFRDELGRLNARIAAESDEVALLVAGRVVRL